MSGGRGHCAPGEPTRIEDDLQSQDRATVCSQSQRRICALQAKEPGTGPVSTKLAQSFARWLMLVVQQALEWRRARRKIAPFDGLMGRSVLHTAEGQPSASKFFQPTSQRRLGVDTNAQRQGIDAESHRAGILR